MNETRPDPGAAGLCQGCAYAGEHLTTGRCRPGDACVRAHSGRQIDRFFRANREEAAAYLADIFWERRAIAARYAPVDSITPLARDPEWWERLAGARSDHLRNSEEMP